MRVWIFADFNDIDDKELELLRTLNITDVVLGVADENPSTFALNNSETIFRENSDQLMNMGIDVHLMSWIRRDSKFIENMAASLTNLTEKISPRSVLLDAEKHWHKGRMSVPNACKLLKQSMSSIQVPIGITGLAQLQSTVKELCRTFDKSYGLPQAYSIWKPGEEPHWSHSDSTSTPHLQRQAFNTWNDVYDTTSEDYEPSKIVMGLAAYWLQRPGVSAESVFNSAIAATKALNIQEVAFWSLNHIKNNPPMQSMIRSIRGQGGEESFSHHTEVQWLLRELEYELGNSGRFHDGVDGKWGQKSQTALNRFRLDHDLPSQGMYDITDVLWLIHEYRRSLP